MEVDAGPPHLEPENCDPKEPSESTVEPGVDEKSSDSAEDTNITNSEVEDLPPVLETAAETNEAEPISEENSTTSEETTTGTSKLPTFANSL